MAQSQNPFEEHIISRCYDDLSKLQALYAANRHTRRENEKGKILDDSFTGWKTDPILAKLHGPDKDTGFVDPRHSIVICVSPPEHVKVVIRKVQEKLRQIVPNIWLTPEENLHMTVLEIASSKTAEEIEAILPSLQCAFPRLAHATEGRFFQPRLIKPMLNYDSSALAISFVPATDLARDEYSYHHLRRDVYSMVASTGVEIGSRYFSPSAHVTIARFITQDGFTCPKEEGGKVDHVRVKDVIEGFEDIDQWLDEFKPRADGSSPPGGMWVVGEDKGLECRKGAIWYGGGEDVLSNQKFN